MFTYLQSAFNSLYMYVYVYILTSSSLYIIYSNNLHMYTSIYNMYVIYAFHSLHIFF